MGARKKTHDIFGPFLDVYSLGTSEKDGSTVRILYEGRTATGAVKGASDMDELFFHWFQDLDEEQREQLQLKYATVAQVVEAKELIAAKARNMLRHYVATLMPQGFKGMVVASSRLACVRYRNALSKARDELVQELEHLPPALSSATGKEIDQLPRSQRLLVRALPHLELLREIDFVPVISGEQNDPADWEPWTGKLRQRAHIEQFKQPLGFAEEGVKHPTSMLIVNSMLLTGFDAPNAQVLYLDRAIREAELLQAIARVNRPAAGKDYGLVVDYFGVTNHLTEALAVYMDPEKGQLDELAEGWLRSLTDEFGRLADRRAQVRQVFVGQGIEPSNDPAVVEQCVELLADPVLRTGFDVALKKFLVSLDIVLPRPEALPYVADAKLFGHIQVAVRRRYRDQGDGGFNPSLYREKVRRLIDEHITVLDLSQKIPPVQITDSEFQAKVAALPSDRAKASEMEHAARHHIRIHLAEDPVRYRRLSDRLDQILKALEGRWAELVAALQSLIAQMLAPEPDDGTGLEPSVERPFHGLLAEGAGPLTEDEKERLIELTREVISHVRNDISAVGFWSNPHKQNQLRKWLKRELDASRLFLSLDVCDQVATELVDLAKHNHHRLLSR